jgi:anti-sigma28 factor (negative regulator of flagellin synthesis)
MSSINGLGGNLPVNSLSGATKSRVAGAAPAAPRNDSVELSGVSQYLAILKNNDVRADKVASVKAAVEAGTYEDDYKLDVAVDRLLEDLND